MTLDETELKAMMTGYDVKHRLDEESEAEIKDQVWKVLSRMIRWGHVLMRAKETLPESESDEESSGDER